MIILNSDSQEDNMIILNGNTPGNIYLFKVKNKNTRLTFHLFKKIAFLNLIKFWKYYGLTGGIIYITRFPRLHKHNSVAIAKMVYFMIPSQYFICYLSLSKKSRTTLAHYNFDSWNRQISYPSKIGRLTASDKLSWTRKTVLNRYK